MIQEREVRQQLAFHLRGEVSLAALERWLAAQSWNMFNESPQAVKLVAEINLLVSELHDRVINRNEFHAEALELLNNIIVREPVGLTLEAQQYFAFIKSAASWNPASPLVEV